MVMSIEDLAKRKELRILEWMELDDEIVILVEEYTVENMALDGEYINGKVVRIRKPLT